MALLAIIIILLAQRYLAIGITFSRQVWFASYVKRMQSILERTPLWSNVVGIIVIMLPILVIVGLLQWVVGDWFWGIFKFFLDLVVLWLCLDGYQLKHHLNDYLVAINKEEIASQEYGLKFIREVAKAKSSTKSGLAREVTCEIFLRSEERLFGVLFWFVIFGSVGAITYFMVVTLRDLATKLNSPFVELLLPASKVFGVLDWIPVRVLCLSYALAGHFINAFNYFRRNFSQGVQQTSEFAINAGFAGLGLEHVDVIHADAEENQNALSLVDRTVYLWIVIVAIFTLGGWL